MTETSAWFIAGQIAVVAVDADKRCLRRQVLRGRRQRGGIAIDAQDPSFGTDPVQQGGGVSAEPQGRIDHGVSRLGREQLQRLRQQNRLMPAGWHHRAQGVQVTSTRERKMKT